MSLSRNLRFEILRRDNFTCRYCGRTAPDVQLTVDHVVPAALGGTDEPSNLTAACIDCNAGKAATPADASMVAEVHEDADRWARAIATAAADRAAERAPIDHALAAFCDIWPVDQLPTGWTSAVERFVELGLTAGDIIRLLDRALERTETLRHAFLYFCKVAWSEVTDLQERARAIVDADAPVATVVAADSATELDDEPEVELEATPEDPGEDDNVPLVVRQAAITCPLCGQHATWEISDLYHPWVEQLPIRDVAIGFCQTEGCAARAAEMLRGLIDVDEGFCIECDAWGPIDQQSMCSICRRNHYQGGPD